MKVLPYLDRILQFSLIMGRLSAGPDTSQDIYLAIHNIGILYSNNLYGTFIIEQSRPEQTDPWGLLL